MRPARNRPAGVRGVEFSDACYKGPAQPSPALGDAINGCHGVREIRCLDCDLPLSSRSTLTADPKDPIHELNHYMRCKDCSAMRGYSDKRSYLLALRTIKISASDPSLHW